MYLQSSELPRQRRQWEDERDNCMSQGEVQTRTLAAAAPFQLPVPLTGILVPRSRQLHVLHGAGSSHPPLGDSHALGLALHPVSSPPSSSVSDAPKRKKKKKCRESWRAMFPTTISNAISQTRGFDERSNFLCLCAKNGRRQAAVVSLINRGQKNDP